MSLTIPQKIHSIEHHWYWTGIRWRRRQRDARLRATRRRTLAELTTKVAGQEARNGRDQGARK